jgi:hypothetical protein
MRGPFNAGWTFSLDNTEPVASGQFKSNRARLTAKSTAMGCRLVVSGVVLHPEMTVMAVIVKILCICVFIELLQLVCCGISLVTLASTRHAGNATKGQGERGSKNALISMDTR